MISTAHWSTKNRCGRLARPFRSAEVQAAASLAEICGVTTIICHGEQPRAGAVRVVYVKLSTQSGDLAEIFRLHRAELVRLAAFILSDRGAGEDAVQDVFMRVYRRGDPIDGDPLLYLRVAVVNSCRSMLRRMRLVRRHAMEDSPCPPLTAEEAAMLSEDRRRVLVALASLPQYYSRGFTLSGRPDGLSSNPAVVPGYVQ